MSTFRKEIPAHILLPFANLHATITAGTPLHGVYSDGQARRRERRRQKAHRNPTK